MKPGLARAGQRDRDAVATGAAGTADAVDIVLGLARRVEVDHVADAGDVDAARGHVGRHQHADAALAQAVEVRLRWVWCMSPCRAAAAMPFSCRTATARRRCAWWR